MGWVTTEDTMIVEKLREIMEDCIARAYETDEREIIDAELRTAATCERIIDRNAKGIKQDLHDLLFIRHEWGFGLLKLKEL